MKNDILGSIILSSVLLLPMVSIGETKKDEVARNQRLIQERKSELSKNIAKKVIEKHEEIDAVLNEKRALCGDERHCEEGVNALRAMLSLIATGKKPDNLAINPALEASIKRNRSRITPEAIIEKPLREGPSINLIVANELLEGKNFTQADFENNLGDAISNSVVSLDKEGSVTRMIIAILGTESSEKFEKNVVATVKKGKNGAKDEVRFDKLPDEQRKEYIAKLFAQWLDTPTVYKEELGKIKILFGDKVVNDVEDAVDKFRNSTEGVENSQAMMRILSVDPKKAADTNSNSTGHKPFNRK